MILFMTCKVLQLMIHINNLHILKTKMVNGIE